jgi:CSLREA domain-containing protein
MQPDTGSNQSRFKQTTHSWSRLSFALTFSLILLGGALALLARPIYALGITVTGNGDTVTADSFCTLREAIQAANTDLAVNECNAGSGVDTIFFSPALSNDTITLTGG